MHRVELSYQPKGSMCATCKHVNKNCSDLDFKSMPKLGKGDADGVVIVRCWEFKTK